MRPLPTPDPRFSGVRYAPTLTACRSCGARVRWGTYAATGRRAPFDVDAHGAATQSHFATCPQRDAWRKRS